MSDRAAIKAEADAIGDRLREARAVIAIETTAMNILRDRCKHPAAARPWPNDYIQQCPDCGHVFYDTAKSTKAD